jgi:type II secretory ATPase GspE/PulE/Tfp pilus assembly ATPase PilB-like protein
VDGELRNGIRYPKHVHDAVVSRIKITSNLDITNRRLPQDGRTTIQTDSGMLDMRVSVVPSANGEKAVIRILSRSTGLLSLDQLGFDEHIRARLLYLINSLHGMLLVTGPTGSGKTSTLYSLLGQIDGKRKSIVTIEDPIEYKFSDATQIAVNDGIGLTFSHALRAILRQDPDIIMVGEVRDRETADIAARSAMTGHLVLTTVHTVDAVSALTRLLEIGLDNYLVASSVTLVLAQRLVREICPDCRATDGWVEIQMNDVAHTINPVFIGKGCDACGGTGYRGRRAVFELLPVDGEIRELLLHGAPEGRIGEVGEKNGMVPMFEVGLDYLAQGITTLDELLSKVPHRAGAGKFKYTAHR